MSSIPRPLAAMAALLVVAGAPAELRFRPAAHSILSKRFEERTSWTLEAIEMSLDGSPVEQDLPEVRCEIQRSIALTDEYEEVSEERVLALRRSFDAIASRSTLKLDQGQGPQEFGAVCASDLEGLAVRFRWDEDEGAYVVDFDESSGDADLLADLEFDADLGGFLPAGEVDVEDEWEVELSALARLFSPSGELWLTPDEVKAGSMFSVPTAVVLASALTNLADAPEEYTGSLVARLVAVEGGRARIEVEVDVDSTADRTDTLIRYVEASSTDASTDALALEFTLDLEGTATIEWDLEENHLASLEFQGDFTVEAEMSWSETIFEEETRFDGVYEVAGSTEFRVSVE